MTVKRYHVEVQVRRGPYYVWRPIKPTDADPYVFTWEEASRYAETYGIARYGSYRMKEIEQGSCNHEWDYAGTPLCYCVKCGKDGPGNDGSLSDDQS